MIVLISTIPLEQRICSQESLHQVSDTYSQNWNSGSNLRLRQKSVKIQNMFQKFFCMVDGHDKTDFWIQKNIWFRPFFDLFTPMLYFHTFLSELQIAPTIPILGVSVRNLVQGLLRTYSWLIRLKF